MGNDSSAITGEGKAVRSNQTEFHRRKNCKKEKYLLQCSLWIIRGWKAAHDIFYDIFRGNGAVFLREFTVCTNYFVRFFTVFIGRKEAAAGVNTVGSQPEAVHEVIIRLKRRKFLCRRTADKNNKGNRVWKNIIYLGGQAGLCRCLVKKQSKKNK